MAGVLVAPVQVVVQRAGLDGVVGVVGVGESELPQRPEVRLDGVGPGRVGRREAELDLVPGRPPADLAAFVGGEVVEDDVDRGAVRADGPDALERGETVIGTLATPVDTPERVVADGVGAGNGVTLRDLLVFADEATEPIVPRSRCGCELGAVQGRSVGLVVVFDAASGRLDL